MDHADALHGAPVPVDFEVAEHETRLKVAGVRDPADKMQMDARTSSYPGFDE